MCQVIIVKRGVAELHTPQEVQDHFNINLKEYFYEDYAEHHMDSCLCQIDLEYFFEDNKIPYKYEARSEWYHVGGDLESLVFD